MPTPNDKLIQRADLALSDLTSNGGILSPEQTETFIDLLLDQPTILKQARQVRMSTPERKINKIMFASRILRAALQTGSALDAGGNDRYVRAADRAKPTTSQITLTTKEVIAEVRLPYEALEDNIEGQAFESHIMRLIAERAAIDLEELALGGDTSLSGSDAYLGLMDGWMKRMTSHVVNNLAAGCNPTMFKNGLLALPQKYHRNLGLLKNFVTVANTIRYRDLVAARGTGYGDSMLTGNGPIFAQGVPVEAAPMLAGVSSGTQGILTFPQNLLFGIQRDVRVETDKDIRSREYIIVLTARVAVQIEDEDASVKYTNIN
jgi:hypothetical protein